MDTLVTFIKQRKYSSGSWQEKIPAFLHPFTFIYVYMQVTNDNFVVNLVISRAVELDSFHTGRKFRLPTGKRWKF